jgi:SNF2 family DNA or RNA helicase
LRVTAGRSPSFFDLPSGQGRLDLMDHQLQGIDFLRERPAAFLADEPGLGKTAQLLLAAVEPVLVVAPAMILEAGVWDDEIAKWAPGLDVTQVAYTSLTQKGPRGKIYRDGMGWPTNPAKPEYAGRRWGTKIADESHYIKGRKTNWTGAFLKLEAEKTFLATGTPIPNWAHEAFTSLQAIYPEESRPGQRFGSYWRWAKEWFDVGPTRWSPMDVGDLREDRTWEEFRESNWGDRFILRLRDQCLDLPPLTQQLWKVKMTPAQARVYRDLKKDFIAWLENGEAIHAWSSAAQVVKLAKCATGLDTLDPTVRESGKLDALRSILVDRPRPTLVVAHFRSSVEACDRVAAEVGKRSFVVHGGVPMHERTKRVRAFQRGEVDVLCASLETISEGLTLHQGGADQVVFVERSAKPSRNEQALRRLHRIGVEVPVTAIDLVTQQSWDERLLRLLKAKTDQQMLALGVRELRGLV